MSTSESTRAADAGQPATPTTAVETFAPLLNLMVGPHPPIQLKFWDGSGIGPDHGAGTVLVRSPDALRRMLWSPGELGLARAYVAGDIEVEGDVPDILRVMRTANLHGPRMALRAAGSVAQVARQTGALGRPLPAPPQEARPRGLRHSRRRDAEVISHHYDLSNDFYRLVLGPSLTYSCARFANDNSSLETAQTSKHELISRKLGLHERPGMRLLDVGCGWGSMALHAATAYGATVVGITNSRAQAELARQRVVAAGLHGAVEIRIQDYRDLTGETFDAVCSIGMFEHVGKGQVAEYFATLRGLLRPQGRLLNHAISSVGGSRISSRSFIGRYIFPDGELIDVGDVLLAMERAGFEVRDVESLREHYARTLRAWVANLEANWEPAVAQVGVARARIWRLYMSGCVVGFDDGGINIHQVLGVLPDRTGAAGMPATRRDWT